MNIARLITFAAVLCLSSAYVVLLDQSRDPDTHRFSYSFLLLLVLTAVLKLFFTCIMWIISIQCTKEEIYHSIPPHTSSGVLATRRIHVDTIEMNASHNLHNPNIPSLKFPIPPSPSGTHDPPTDRTMERQSLLIAGGTSNLHRADSVDSSIAMTPFRPTPLHPITSPPSHCTLLFYDFLRFAISAAIYTVNDIFVFVVMNQGFSARAYTVLVTGKISIVCILSRIVLKRKSTIVQYIAVFLLSIGIVVSAWPFTEDPNDIRPTLGGYGIVLLAEVIGAVAGVYNEWLMKRLPPSPIQQPSTSRAQRHLMYYQNIHMYSATVVILIPVMMIWDHDRVFAASDAPGLHTRLFSDWSTLLTFTLIINACRGLSIAAIYTYSTILSKIFIIACSILLTAVVTHFALDSPLDMQFVLALAIILCALYLYAAPPQHLIAGAHVDEEKSISQPETISTTTSPTNGYDTDRQPHDERVLS